MINEESFFRWQIHSARDWKDIADLLAQSYIPILDRDHKQLTRYVIDFNEMMEQNLNRPRDQETKGLETQVLTGFINYLTEHFQREEKIILLIDPEKEKEQRSEHLLILSRLKEVRILIESGKSLFNNELRLEILNQIVLHTNEHDSDINLSQFRHYLRKVSSFREIAFLLTEIGSPEIDEAIKSLFLTVLNKFEQKDFLVLYEKSFDRIIELFRDQMAVTGLSIAEGISKKLEEAKSISKETYLSEKDLIVRRGDILFVHLTLIAKFIDPYFGLGAWLGKYLSKIDTYVELSFLIKWTGINSIDKRYEEVLSKLIDAYRLWEDSKKEEAITSLEEVLELMNGMIVYHQEETKNLGIDYKLFHQENLKRTANYFNLTINYIKQERLGLTRQLRNRLLTNIITQVNYFDHSLYHLRALEFME